MHPSIFSPPFRFMDRRKYATQDLGHLSVECFSSSRPSRLRTTWGTSFCRTAPVLTSGPPRRLRWWERTARDRGAPGSSRDPERSGDREGSVESACCRPSPAAPARHPIRYALVEQFPHLVAFEAHAESVLAIPHAKPRWRRATSSRRFRRSTKNDHVYPDVGRGRLPGSGHPRQQRRRPGDRRPPRRAGLRPVFPGRARRHGPQGHHAGRLRPRLAARGRGGERPRIVVFEDGIIQTEEPARHPERPAATP